jgi:hypothetical protein
MTNRVIHVTWERHLLKKTVVRIMAGVKPTDSYGYVFKRKELITSSM